jgi:hypothetical protein
MSSFKEITAGIRLFLRDEFSPGLQSAGIAAAGFGQKAVAVAGKVNAAFSGVAGTLGTLGVSVGVLGTFKSLIDLDDRMARLGLTAELSAKQVNEWKRRIFEVARMPDIKIGVEPIISASEKVMEATGDYDFTEANIENIARLNQASAAVGDNIGNVFAQFAKNNLSKEDIARTLDNMVVQGDMGLFNFKEFAGVAERITASYMQDKYSRQQTATGEDFTRMGAAMQMLRSVSGTEDVAATLLESAMSDFNDVDKIKKFKRLGLVIRDDKTGEMRDFNDIMMDAAKIATDFRKKDELNKIFGDRSQRALVAYQSAFAKNLPLMLELGDTTGTLAHKSAFMADTLKSSVQNLQTAFLQLADSAAEGSMKGLVDFMNYLSEDPRRMEEGIKRVAAAFAGLAAIRVGAGIVSFAASLKSLVSGSQGLKGGGGIGNAGGLAGIAGGATPVYVTNWGGMPSSPAGGQPKGGAVPAGVLPGSPTGVPMLGSRTNAANFAKGARTAGILTVAVTGVTQAIGAYRQVKAIDADTEKTDREKSKEKGGVIGAGIGTTVGTGAGVLAGSLLAGKVGAMIGTAIAPGIGTAIGGAIGIAGGALVGWLGGMAGRKTGEFFGDLSGFKAEQAALRSEVQTVETVRDVSAEPQKIELEGHADMRVQVDVSGERPTARVSVDNRAPWMNFETGNAPSVRGMAY